MNPKLARGLEELVRRTDFASRLRQDPVAIPRRFKDPADIEVAGWLAVALAYGQVPQFQAVLEKTLAVMGGCPGRFAADFDPRRDAGAFRGLYYRMTSGLDLACLVYLAGRVGARWGSVGACFQSFYRGEEDVGPALDRFVDEVLKVDTAPVYGRRAPARRLAQFLAKPALGSACKRLNLYLRWMVRPDDGVDFGLWKGVPPSALVVPLDTHVLRIGRYLGLTRRRSPGWATALEVTRALKRYDPEDPLRFDLALCHHGISGACPIGRAPEKCSVCPLLPACAKGRRLVPAA